MPYELEVNAQGVLYLPPELLDHLKAHTRYEVQIQGDT